MKISWILPDRGQTGTMLLAHSGSIEPLHKVLNLHVLPRAFILGIPEELFLTNRNQPVFFLQYARLGDGLGMFAAALEAGKDIGGRAVVLTLLIEQCEPAMLKFEMIADIEIPTSETVCAKDLLSELTKQFSERASPLNSLLNAIEQFPERQTFASEVLRRSANRPEWMKKKGYGIESDNG